MRKKNRCLLPRQPSTVGRCRSSTLLIGGLSAALLLTGGCASKPTNAQSDPAPAHPTVSTSSPGPTTSPTTAPTSSPTPSPAPSPSPIPTLLTSDGEPREASLTIPDLDLEDVEVVPYEGQTDDGPGTKIQDGGVAASPYGPNGGVGPGGIGNYQITAHRNTAGGPFEDLLELEQGALVEVSTDDQLYIYEIVETRKTSFRSKESLAEQRAAVPGHPGKTPTEAMITLSTCRTQEDHAEGNWWHDEFKNPEHRIDKIGVLIESRPIS